MSVRPSTVAPPRVASRRAWRTVMAAGPPRPRATSSAWRASASMSLRSFDAGPSTPSPTGTPASSMARIGATPAPSRRLDVGQWATPVRVWASRSTSVTPRWMECAHQTSGASHSTSAR